MAEYINSINAEADVASDRFDCAPILLVGFNRPDYMAEQIAAIRAARPQKLYLAVDGPRADRPGETDLCCQVRRCAKLIDWPCEVKTLFREKNLGCKYGVSGAITWFFENESEGIILEDDCRPTIDFLRFATEMLERYRDNGRIGAVSAMNLYGMQTDRAASYHFNTHINVWGWATWRRVWKNYTTNIEVYAQVCREVAEKGHATHRARKAALNAYDAVVAGLQTWDYQLGFMIMSHGLLVVTPCTKLVSNCGLGDKRGTNTSGYNFDARNLSRVGSISFPLVHPAKIEADWRKIEKEERREYGILPRAFTYIGTKAPILCGLIDTIGGILEKLTPFLFRL